MERPMFSWALFCAVLVPLFLRVPGDSLATTSIHIGICFALLAFADKTERASRAI